MATIFRNRVDAGQQLAACFADLRDRGDVIVLGLPRGGVPVAAEVARAIGAQLDVVLVRKIGTPGREELAAGAIASGDEVVLDEEIITHYRISQAQIDGAIETQRRILAKRERLYRGDRPAPNPRGQTVLLIDDGLATGSTMRVAIQAVQRQHPAAVMVGVPVASPDRLEMIGREVNRIECVLAPDNFAAVGQFYFNFLPTSDVDVVALLDSH